MSQDVSMAISAGRPSISGRLETYSNDISMSRSSKLYTAPYSWPRSSEHFQAPKLRGSVFRAPEDTDSEDEELAPSFSLQAPDSTDEEDDGEVTSRPQSTKPHLQFHSAAEAVLQKIALELNQTALERSRKKIAAFNAALREIDEQEKAERKEIEADVHRRRMAEAGEEAAKRAEISESQKQLISDLQQEHILQANLMMEKTQEAMLKEEAERQRLLEAERQENAARQLAAKQEAERKASEELRQKQLAAKQEQELQQREEAVQQEQKQKEQVADNSEATSVASGSDALESLGVCIAPEAKIFEASCRDAVQAAKRCSAQLDLEGSSKSEKRRVAKALRKLCNQVGGTQDQVEEKVGQMLQILSSLSEDLKTFGLWKTFQALVDLAERVNTKFAVAEVAVAVCRAHPAATLMLLGTLHEVCPLAVPKCILRSKGESLDSYRARWLFQKVEKFNEEKGGMVEEWEDIDVLLLRITSQVEFLAAFYQSDGQTEEAAQHAWSYLARMLNVCPPNRFTAFALAAFIRTAGYKLHLVFRRQFIKLLMYLDQNFIEEIIRSGMEDARSAVRRLRLYLQSQEYQQPPVGRILEKSDASTYDRA